MVTGMRMHRGSGGASRRRAARRPFGFARPTRRGETPVRALPGAAPRPAAAVREAHARGRTCRARAHTQAQARVRARHAADKSLVTPFFVAAPSSRHAEPLHHASARRRWSPSPPPTPGGSPSTMQARDGGGGSETGGGGQAMSRSFWTSAQVSFEIVWASSPRPTDFMIVRLRRCMSRTRDSIVSSAMSRKAFTWFF